MPEVLRLAMPLWVPVALPAPVAVCRLSGYQAVAQCQTQWCWAALLQEMLRVRKGVSISQCRLVRGLLTSSVIRAACDCGPMGDFCDINVNLACNGLDVLEDRVSSELLGVPRSPPLATLNTALLCGELSANDPVLGLFVDGSRHYAMITAASTIGKKDYVEIMDPDRGRTFTLVPIDNPKNIRLENRLLNTVYFI